MNETAKAFLEKRQELIEEMKLVTDKATAEKRNLTREESEQLSKLDEQQEQYAERAESLSKIEHVNNLTNQEVREKIISSPYHMGGKPFKSQEERGKAIQGWLYQGSNKQKPEYWRAAEREGIDINCPVLHMTPPAWEERTTNGQTVGSPPGASNGAGGYFVANDNQLMNHIDVALKFYGNVLPYCTVIDTPTGGPLPWTLNDDTANSGEYKAEKSGVTVLDTVIQKNTLNAYKIQSKALELSWEMMQDSAPNIIQFVGTTLGRRYGVKANSAIMADTGGGSAINGILNTVHTGFQSTSTESAGPLYSDLVSLIESLDEAYQQEGNAMFMFAQSFRAKLRNILDQNDRPIIWSLVDSLASGMKQAVLDHPYVLNAAIPSWGHTGSGSGAAGNLCALFGNFKNVIVRRVTGGEGGYNLVRDDYTGIQTGVTYFWLWGRMDALLSDAGQHPLVAFQAPNS